MTLGRSQAAAQLTEHGLAPRRSLGQNFVVDANTVRRIARLAGVGAGDHVVEVGAGLGSLTLALAETGADVLAIEIDDHLIEQAMRTELLAGASDERRLRDLRRLLAGTRQVEVRQAFDVVGQRARLSDGVQDAFRP